ncbi:Arylsulfatase [Bremerella volcania]|uniref:Arylsulfatase n=1 Tax=Bremerella volcania TaxID=2527984 RepID=A0A518C9D2_9BACT|nr:sulfatase [Bremerella volcania]QDU75831.1 Arylsulfatase [Bremerella volcania]
MRSVKISLFVCCLAAAWAQLLAERSLYADEAKTKPNVLFLVADDMNSWPLGDATRYQGKVNAPNIDRLAQSGVNFTRAYTAAPVCSPSRTAFFSGVSPWKSGHYHNALQVRDSKPLNEALSLAGMFKKAGYHTASFGKITHGWDQREHWDVRLGHKRDPAPPGAPLTAVGKGEQDWGPIHLPEAQMNDSKNADAAITELQRQHDKPFFIAFGTFNPHMPWYVPQKYFDMFPISEIATPELKKDDLDDVPPLGKALTEGKSRFVDAVLEHGLHKEAVQAYLATIAYADAQIGRVLNALDESPHKDNTIVVLLTDHGFHLGEKHHWQKATLWEEGTHSLLMIRVPGMTPQGQPSERFVSLQDIYPTLAEVCGTEAPDYIDGKSLVPLLKDPNAPWQSTAVTCLSGDSSQGYITIRNDQGRYIRYGDGQEEFYDSAQDPHEWTNEIDNTRFASTIEALRNALPSLTEMAKPLPHVRRK